MQEILDAILSNDATSEDFAAVKLPESYRAVTLHKDEEQLFAGLDSRDKDPASPFTSTRSPCPSWAPARPWSPSWPAR